MRSLLDDVYNNIYGMCLMLCCLCRLKLICLPWPCEYSTYVSLLAPLSMSHPSALSLSLSVFVFLFSFEYQALLCEYIFQRWIPSFLLLFCSDTLMGSFILLYLCRVCCKSFLVSCMSLPPVVLLVLSHTHIWTVKIVFFFAVGNWIACNVWTLSAFI